MATKKPLKKDGVAAVKPATKALKKPLKKLVLKPIAKKPPVPAKVVKAPKPVTLVQTAAPEAVVKKRKERTSGIPLFVPVKLGKLVELFDNDEAAEILVSRNFVMAKQKAKLENKAQLELGI